MKAAYRMVWNEIFPHKNKEIFGDLLSLLVTPTVVLNKYVWVFLITYVLIAGRCTSCIKKNFWEDDYDYQNEYIYSLPIQQLHIVKAVFNVCFSVIILWACASIVIYKSFNYIAPHNENPSSNSFIFYIAPGLALMVCGLLHFLATLRVKSVALIAISTVYFVAGIIFSIYFKSTRNQLLSLGFKELLPYCIISILIYLAFYLLSLLVVRKKR